MALEIPLPRTILTTAHWTIGRQKMAKSTGNVVNPFFAIDRFDPDIMRFYLTHDGGISDDSDYDNAFIAKRYRTELQNNLGGLASRIVRGRGWNVRNVVKIYTSQGMEPWEGSYAKQRDLLEQTRDKVINHMKAMEASAAVKETLSMVHKTNVFLQHAQPWTSDPGKLGQMEDSPYRKERTIFLCAEALRFAAIMLQPVLPNYMATLLGMLGVAKDKRSLKHVVFGLDHDYGQSTVYLGRGVEGALFPTLLVND